MIMLVLCLIWLFLDIVATSSISLEFFNNTLTDCDKGYIEIRCVFDGEFIAEFDSVSLKRVDANVSEDKDLATFSKGSVLMDPELANRHGVIDTSLINNVSLSYLSIKIMSSGVNPLQDKGLYQCVLSFFDTEGGFLIKKSMQRMLNITDIECSDQTTVEIQYRKISPTVFYVETQPNNVNSTILKIGMYRQLTVVTGVVICFILLLIMMREIRMYYCTSEDIVIV